MKASRIGKKHLKCTNSLATALEKMGCELLASYTRVIFRTNSEGNNWFTAAMCYQTSVTLWASAPSASQVQPVHTGIFLRELLEKPVSKPVSSIADTFAIWKQARIQNL